VRIQLPCTFGIFKWYAGILKWMIFFFNKKLCQIEFFEWKGQFSLELFTTKCFASLSLDKDLILIYLLLSWTFKIQVDRAECCCSVTWDPLIGWKVVNQQKLIKIPIICQNSVKCQWCCSKIFMSALCGSLGNRSSQVICNRTYS